jgi:hypothetical protein
MASVGVVTGVAAFVFFVSLGGGVKKAVMGEVLKALPVNVLEVTPKQGGLGLLSLGGAGLLGDSITDDTLERLRGIPGVSAVAPEMAISVPIQARGMFFGRSVVTDLAGTGIDHAVVTNDVAPGLKFEYDPHSDTVPVIVSSQLLELYNSNVAPSMKLPRISREMASKVDFTLVVGRSYLGGTPDPSKVREYHARVVGVSPRAVLIGITVPIGYARRWAEDNGSGKGEIRYKSAYVTVSTGAEITPAITAIEAMGLEVDKIRKTAGGLLSLATLLMALFSMLIIAVAAVGISHTFFMAVYERRREIGVMRSVGASRGDIVAMILWEAASVGALSGAAGTLLGWLLTLAADLAASRLIPPFPFKPAEFFAFTPATAAAALAFAVVFCVAGGLFPAMRAAGMDPADALRS